MFSRVATTIRRTGQRNVSRQIRRLSTDTTKTSKTAKESKFINSDLEKLNSTIKTGFNHVDSGLSFVYFALLLQFCVTITK